MVMPYKARREVLRFWEKVDWSSSCWIWTASTNGRYGKFYRTQPPLRGFYAHRYAYECLIGPIPEGLVIDHLCRNVLCVNPSHLEPVTPRENALRGEGPSARQARQTHCKRGHPLSGPNLRIDSAGSRRCVTCVTATNRRSGKRRTERERAERAARVAA